MDLVRSVHPPSGTDLWSLFSAGSADPRRLERLASLLTEDFEVVGGDLIGELGLTAGGQGVEGLVTAWREWLRPWETYWSEVEDYVDAGHGRVVVLVRDHGRLRGSEAEVENIGASVWTLREGRIARIGCSARRGASGSRIGTPRSAAAVLPACPPSTASHPRCTWITRLGRATSGLAAGRFPAATASRVDRRQARICSAASSPAARRLRRPRSTSRRPRYGARECQQGSRRWAANRLAREVRSPAPR